MWYKQHRSLDPSCRVSTTQAAAAAAAGLTVQGMFSYGPTVDLTIAADRVHFFMATPSRITHHDTKLKSFQTGLR